jgi:hypothetical protein
MSSRKLDELATDVDDAATVVSELKDDPTVDATEKLDELADALEHATEAVDDLSEDDKA